MNRVAPLKIEPPDAAANTVNESKQDVDLAELAHPKKLTITFTINFCFVLLLLTSLSAILWSQWSTGRRNIEELLASRAEMVIGHLDNRIRVFMNPASVYVTRMARRAARDGWDLVDQSFIDRLLETSINAAPQITSASVLSPDGTERRAVTNSDASFYYVETHKHEKTRFLDLLERLKWADGPVWTPPVYRTEQEAVVMEVWHPIRQGNRLVGAWGASISIASLSNIVAQFGDEYDGTAFILHGRNRVLAHPNLLSAHPGQNVGTAVVRLDQLGDYYLHDIWSNLDENLLDAETPTNAIHKVRYTSADVDHIAFYRWVDRYDHVPWIIGIMFPAKPLDVQYDRLLTATYIGLGALVIALLLAMMLGRAIARPIKRTANDVSKIGKLDFDDLPPLPRSLFKEIDELSTSYNGMLRGLRLFQTYIPRKLVRRLVNDGSDAVASVEKRVAVMFTDIVGFTSMCEGKPATEVAEFVNHHFQIIGECVDATGGTIDKYIGDSVMAFWGAPESMADAAGRACDAARAIAEAMEMENKDRRAHGKPPVHVRIGIHVGPVVVGNIGATERVNYTIIGDTVNTCQRIEKLAREVPSRATTTILISDAVALDLPASKAYVEVGSFKVKGKASKLKIYHLIA